MIRTKFTNDLLTQIHQKNLAPRYFESKHGSHGEFDSFTISVKDSPLYFRVRTMRDESGWLFDCYYSTYRPGHPEPTYPEGSKKRFTSTKLPDSSFDQLQAWLSQWLQKQASRFLADKQKEEDDRLLPDLWAEVAATSKTTDLAQASVENTAFTAEEINRLETSLNDFATRVQEHNLLAEDQIKLLNEQVTNLVGASRRLGRKDWLIFLLGSLVSFAASAGFSPDVANMLIKLGGESVHWIARNPQLLR